MKKTTMKRLVALMLSTSFAVSATACGGQSNAGSAADTQSSNTSISNQEVSEPAITLTYAEVNPETSLMGKTATYFKEKVYE